MTSDPVLLRWYRAFNRKYWNGELPEVELVWEACGKRYGGDTSEIKGGEGELMIRIDPQFIGAPETAKLKLIHEMRHVRLWEYRNLTDHGQRFDEETKRLCGYRSYRDLL